MLLTFLALAVNCNEIKMKLFSDTKNTIINKMNIGDYHIFSKRYFDGVDFILIEKEGITLRRESSQKEIKEKKILFTDILDNDKFIKQNLFLRILKFFKNDGPKMLRIVIGDNVPKVENFLADNFNYYIYERDKIYHEHGINYEIPYDEFIVEQFTGPNFSIELDVYISKWISHEDFYLNFDVADEKTKMIIRTKFSDYDLAPLVSDFLRRVFLKNLIDINRYSVLPKHLPNLTKENYIFDFICKGLDLHTCMMFYTFYNKTVENFFYRKPQNNIKFENDKNEFLQKFVISVKDQCVKINDENIFTSLSYIKNFVQIYYEILPSVYEVSFYLFNATRCTRVYEIVMEDLLSPNNEQVLFLYLLKSFGFLREQELSVFLKNKDYAKIQGFRIRIIQEVKREINKFIYEDMYKAFVIIYCSKLSDLIKENNELKEIFSLLFNKEIMEYILDLPINYTMREYTELKKQNNKINGILDTNLYCLIKHCLENKNAIIQAQSNIIGKLLNITELALGNKLSINEKSVSLISCFNHEDNEENRNLYSVDDVLKAITDTLNE